MRTTKIALLHIPKAGGKALAWHVWQQTCRDKYYFFTFGPGPDTSNGTNKMLVETLRKGDERYHRLLRNAHFRESQVISGHFSYDLRNILGDFSFQFATVVREPIGRCISHINQLTRVFPTGERFGAFDVPTRAEDPDGYWRAIAAVLEKFPRQQIPGLNAHNSMFLSNAMCHMIGGTPLHTYTPDVDVDRALDNLSVFGLALFEQFNESCSAMLRSLDIPVVLNEQTNVHGEGYPPIYAGHAVNYGAPADVIELIESMNQEDVRLYREATKRCAAYG